MKIPFDIKFRPQIESGEYKVILDCGVEAEILAWNKPGDYPIVCMAKKDGAIPFRVDNNGKAYHFPEGANYSDLFIVMQEEELTDFEKKLWEVLKSEGSPIGPIEKFTNADKEVFHSYASELLSIAKKELREQIVNHTKEAYENGKVEALKNLPRWNESRGVYIDGWINDGFLYYKNHSISLKDLEKLPGFKEDEK